MATWKELPEHVLVEILLKLSVKSLIRLSCVSKKLRALIKNSNFTSLYSKYNKQDILLVQREVEGHRVISFYSLTDDDSLTLTQQQDLRLIPCFQNMNMSSRLLIIGPCNGLICVSDDHRFGRDKFVLCNPILQEFKLLPPTTISCRRDLVMGTIGLSLGFDPCSNDYKLVRIVHIYFPGMITDDEDEDADEDEEKDEEGIKAEVYDLGTNLWRRIEAQVPSFNYGPNFEFFYKGCCYIGGRDSSICFNTSSETFTVIDYPERGITNSETVEILPTDDITYDDIENILKSETAQLLTVLNDCLALFIYKVYNMKEPKLIDIWVMKEYGNKESWVKQFTIGPILLVRPLSSRNNFILFEGENQQLICCRLDTNKVTKSEIYSRREYTMDAVIYRESFVSINALNKGE